MIESDAGTRRSTTLQLAESAPSAPSLVTVSLLDTSTTGSTERRSAAPMYLVRANEWRANAVGLLRYARRRRARLERVEPPVAPGAHWGATHGLGARWGYPRFGGAGLRLDERKVPGGRIKDYYVLCSVATFPLLHKVVPVRVAHWVFSVSTGGLAYAIDWHASRVKGAATIIAASHGGTRELQA